MAELVIALAELEVATTSEAQLGLGMAEMGRGMDTVRKDLAHLGMEDDSSGRDMAKIG
jgi:hypothetical protein